MSRVNIPKKTIENLNPAKTVALRGNEKSAIYMNEYGVYELVMKSEMEAVEVFQDWLIEDIIPSIRKTGKYVNQDLIDHIQKLDLENQTLTTDIQALTIDIQESKTENKQVK